VQSQFTVRPPFLQYIKATHFMYTPGGLQAL
jgi:hypothetical protein